MTIITRIKSFDQLSTAELYDILRLRTEVFLMEQQCLYQDLDNQDQNALHFQYRSHDQLVGYARVLAYDAEHMSFGRLITAKAHRGKALGRRIMDEVMTYLQTQYPAKPLAITAQHYLEKFYQQYGFETRSEPYMHEQRLHIDMVRPA